MNASRLILVVDDDEDIGLLLADVLAREGYRVVLAPDGDRALKLVERESPDLLIIDMLLRGEHGIEVMQQVKERFFLPVIGISGIYDRCEIEVCLGGESLEGFFSKPIDLPQLLLRVHELLQADRSGH